MAAYRNRPPQAGESEHGWRWTGWLRSWFDDAREMMSSHMPYDDTMPMSMDLESPHARREEAMRHIMRMRNERARMAVARMGADVQAAGGRMQRMDTAQAATDWQACREQALPFFTPPAPVTARRC